MWWLGILYRFFTNDLIDKMTLKKTLIASEGVSWVNILKTIFLIQRKCVQWSWGERYPMTKWQIGTQLALLEDDVGQWQKLRTVRTRCVKLPGPWKRQWLLLWLRKKPFKEPTGRSTALRRVDFKCTSWNARWPDGDQGGKKGSSDASGQIWN